MKCNNCGEEFEGDVCPKCGAPAEKGKENNPLEGKEYRFSSRRGTRAGLFITKIMSGVKVERDRLVIDIVPKKLNKSPVVLIKDILSVETTRMWSKYYMFFVIVSLLLMVICGMAGVDFVYIVLLIVLTILNLYRSLHTKIVIHQRNGITITLYSADKGIAEQFKEEISSLIRTV